MAKRGIVLNTRNIQSELLRNPDIAKFCEDVARERMPDGCEATTISGRDRTHIFVKPVTKEAKNDVYSNNSLEKAFYPTRRGKS